MKRKYLFIALAMGTLAFSQTVPTKVNCAKPCIKYYKEDTKGNTIHHRDCVAEVYMDNLDPCLFDKHGLVHPLHIELYELREEVIVLREIIEKQREYLERVRKVLSK
jgi:hypothetical protein